ncbi:pentapeptide repeat-containing protein [Cellulophaga baltica]|uniref:pentapeptide repeat-containing protein n=1 Tax=Cellulophaga baltica TaxID=76594 RepID=UPI0015F4BEE4|nr:pentapeptide repeat-containing protein [Cellulophaga baltica]MBA6316901.1 pentapeptide repeat-containing protein [Cellulophaga baltica]
MTNKTPKYVGDLLERYAEGEREFPNCDFEAHENLQNMTFDNSNLQRSIFFSADFTGSSFKNCNLKKCSFKYCKFEQVDFENADLSDSFLSGAEFINCNFKNAKLDNSDWYGHKLTTEEFLTRINIEK